MAGGDELAALRAKLDRIDRALIEHAAERQRTVMEIGRIKQSVGRPLRDFGREREVLDGVRAHAERSGLDPDVAETLLIALIDASLTRQEADRVALAARGGGRRALVIGGAGRMGQWLARFLDGQGFEVTIADPSCTNDRQSCVSDWRTAPLDVDVIVVAAPIAASARILEALSAIGPPGLVFDVASIKSPLAAALAGAAAAGLNVCSIHPMFGPDTRLLAGRHIVFVDCGSTEAVAQARALFEDTMAICVDVEMDAHDRLMAWVLGMSHALNIAFASALADSGVDIDALAGISSTTFRRQLEIATNVASENPELYFEIQRMNPHEPRVLDQLDRAMTRLREAVSGGDADAFVRLMQRGADFTRRHRTASEAVGLHDQSARDSR